MPQVIRGGFGVLLILLALLFGGCTAREASQNLENVDRGIGEMLEKLRSEQNSASTTVSEYSDNEERKDKGESSQEKTGSITADELTSEQKRAIDEWLLENGYNRYGDSQNVIYAGGTPLFNEKTGESMGRYEYILKKFPNILERVEDDL